MAKRYQQEVAKIILSFNHDDTRTQAAESLRGMIKKIILTPKPCDKEYSIDLHGDLAGILSIAAGRKTKLKSYDPLIQQVSNIVLDSMEKESDSRSSFASIMKDLKMFVTNFSTLPI